MPSSTFAIDGIVANRGFSCDAFILGNRLRHDRTLDHTGVQTADTVVLTSTIGPYIAGSTVESVLLSMVNRLNDLDSTNRKFGTFTMNAYIPTHFTLNAVIKRAVSASFTANAVITSAQKNFTANAIIRFTPEEGAVAFTIDAFVV